MPAELREWRLEAAIGTVRGVESDQGLVAIHIGPKNLSDHKFSGKIEGASITGVDPWSTASGRQVAQFLAGKRKNFDLEIDIAGRGGTEFQIAVWRACAQIPAGQTTTYGRLAAAIGKPAAARAVGGALGKNPIPVVVPCHRVVGVNGLTGFGSGLDVKQKLLDLEQGGPALMDPGRLPLIVSARDLWRATLPDNCGNVGYIGISPDNDQYHVVVPVDAQIARGVKAGNLPYDGTPFGGYKDWRYFRCPPYPPSPRDPRADNDDRLEQARRTGLSLAEWGEGKRRPIVTE